MRNYGDPVLDYTHPPRHENNHYTHISRSKPPIDIERTKNHKKLTFIPTTPTNYNNNYDKENTMINCKSTVNIMLPH